MMLINKKNVIIVILIKVLFVETVYAEVLWEQNFNNSPLWQSTSSETQDVSSMATHEEAVSMWNVSSYRVAKQKYNTGGTTILEVSSIADRQGDGRGLIYYFNAVDDWQAASIDIAFNDPDINWKTTVDASGYSELWLTLWYKTPEKMIWYNQDLGEDVSVGFELWKGCRFWAYDYQDYVQKYNQRHGTSFLLTPEGHWQTLLDDNAILSSHYLDGGNFYKKPFYIFSWYGQTLFNQPAWLKETDADAGTSGFPSAQNRNDLSTHLLSGINWWSDYSNATIPGILGDLGWHKVEYHAKLNDLGQSNSIEEVYVDNSPTPLHTLANNQIIRITDRKFQQVILFDNYYKKYGGKQAMYIDDIVLSTERLPSDYVIGDTFFSATRSDVNQDNQVNTTDALLTLRKSLGLDMSNTNWNNFSAETGDVNCNNSVTTADALLLLRQSVGLDMGNTEWCGG